MATATLAGSTGMVGTHILTELLAHPSISAVYAYSRRDLANPTASTKLFPLTSTDTTSWPAQFPRELKPKIFLSALGTTRAAAGGLEAQKKIDLDLNYELARAAKDAGVETYVLVSTSGANAHSSMGYAQMKGELEEKVKDLGFKHTVILRPGLIMGERAESRPAEAALRGFAGLLKKVSPALTNFWGQDARIIGKAAVLAGVQCLEGKRESGIWMLGQADIVRLGGEGKA
ncbi:NAD dependent epimerase/dehydratase family protein-like protein [Lentithecium fluviatile CBS 122367]|uniref:NAD dependent epimerase/dehydratase family protein-like protein n=1 Tax=Lentithecium fluviatile CBS 122367 TaxID=1168545 RepID=A0A6G1IE30_9PLEO|nr:NAD dependent epimerase/dehydratase family protein-like protein [Lentithecium fluviatile CBS 122367]